MLFEPLGVGHHGSERRSRELVDAVAADRSAGRKPGRDSFAQEPTKRILIACRFPSCDGNDVSPNAHANANSLTLPGFASRALVSSSAVLPSA